MYLHYLHFNKIWYFWRDNSDCKKIRIFSSLLEEKNAVPNSCLKTKSEIQKFLKEEYPEDVLVHTISYHEGPKHIKGKTTDERKVVRRKNRNKEKFDFS